MLPSGIFMLPSKFGYIITGRYPENNCDNQDRSSSSYIVGGYQDKQSFIRSEFLLLCQCFIDKKS